MLAAITTNVNDVVAFCGTRNETTVVNTTLDLVGYGVLAAFFFTALISIVAVICAYLSQSLDEDSLNYIDRRLIHTVHRLWQTFMPSKPDDSSLPERFVRIQDFEARRLRKEAVVGFILSLSDQQLVTGLAILIAGVANAGKLTRFEFIAVHSLAWFSSTTHLATLDCLSEYFRSHKVPRHSRSVGIVVFVALLVAAIVIRALIAMSGIAPTALVSIAFKPGTVHVQPCSNWHGWFNILWQESWLSVLGLVVLGYLVRIQDFYCGCRSPVLIPSWLLWRSMHSRATFTEYRVTYNERHSALLLRRLLCRSKRPRWQHVAPFDYSGSFLSRVPPIMFSFCYGTTQVAASRFGLKVQLPANAVWGYGQIVSVLLLCVPFVSLCEILSLYQAGRRRSETHVRRISETGSLGVFDSNLLEQLESSQHFDGNWDESDNPPETINSRFHEGRAQIGRYLRRELNDLDNDGELKADSVALFKRKRTILQTYEVIKACQDQVSTWPSIAWFLASLLGAIACGILLNLADFDGASEAAKYRILFAMAILFLFLGAKIMDFALEMWFVLTCGGDRGDAAHSLELQSLS